LKERIDPGPQKSHVEPENLTPQMRGKIFGLGLTFDVRIIPVCLNHLLESIKLTLNFLAEAYIPQGSAK
jgi:hypothetical protein